MKFQDVIGLDEVKQLLVSSVDENRVSHAQLFLGKEGIGKLPMALAYVQYLNCEDKKEGDSCGECPSCLKISKLAHPDVHFSFPIIKSGTSDVSDNYVSQFREAITHNPYIDHSRWYQFLGEEKKQGIIPTDESNLIINKLSLKAYEGGYKVLIMWGAELLHPSASNKLLKIIEEPPEKTIFILLAEDQEKILPTVLSRTQIIKFRNLSADEVEKGLVAKFNIEKESAKSLAFLTEGNFLEAMHLATDENDEQFNFVNFRNWMRLCFQRDVLGVVPWVEEIARIGREKQKIFLQYGLHLLRQCLIGNYGQDDLVRLFGSEKDFAGKFAPFIHSDNIVELMNAFDKAHRDIGRNANAKILFLDLSFEVFILLKK